MNYLRMDLKVCEGCGALWLRAGIGAGVYCKECVAVLVNFPEPRGRRTGTRRPMKTVARSCAGGAR